MNIKLILKILFAIRQLRRNEHLSRGQLEKLQRDNLRSICDYAYAFSPFYQKFHKGLENRPLNELPVLTKNILMENFNDLVTDREINLEKVREFLIVTEQAADADKNRSHSRSDNLFLGRYWVTATSGSSGHPGFFLFNESEWTTLMASFARGQEWTGTKVDLRRRRKMATVASISPWHMSSQVAATAKTWFTPSIRIAASTPLEKIVDQLNEWKPDLLIAYASMARILAEEQLANRLRIFPQKVFTSSEVLTNETRRRIKDAWGDEPYNQYGATETADIAAEYKTCRRMHIFEDILIVENVDDKNRPVPGGEYGAKLLVTTLFSRTQPLIRYEINDSVRLLANPCPDCSLPFAVMDGIQGRKEDALYFSSVSAGVSGKILVQPLVFNRVMDILPVSGWQVIQEADDSLRVLLRSPRGGLRAEHVAESLRKELSAEGAVVGPIKVELVDEIGKTASGKTPLIKSNPGKK